MKKNLLYFSALLVISLPLSLFGIEGRTRSSVYDILMRRYPVAQIVGQPNAQALALYEAISAPVVFGGIMMQIPDAFLSQNNPLGGSFVYCDVQPGVMLDENYLRSPERRWFMSYDVTGVQNSADVYVGADNFPGAMIEFGQGNVFDAAGENILAAPME